MSVGNEIVKRILLQAGAFVSGAKMPQVINDVAKFESQGLITEEERTLAVDALRTKMLTGNWPWEIRRGQP